MSIRPHGGILINREKLEAEQNALLKKAKNLKKLKVSKWTISDLEMIGTGVFSPLQGFMNSKDYLSVLLKDRLKNNIIWPIPITLPAHKKEIESFQIGDTISLIGEDGVIYGLIHLEEMYTPNKLLEAEKVYRTTDPTHPGVKRLYECGEIYLAGPIILLNRQNYNEFHSYYKTPKETRELFKKLGWKTIVGFQTRNPVHRAHEYIQKCALEIVDGLLLNPLVGETKADDIPANVRMRSYEVLLENYFPKNRTKLIVFPAAMRFAGPKEALLHAIARKNYGCTHFIIGRDHAGVGDFYGTYDAQKYVEQFEDELGIQILKFDHAFYCKKCENMTTEKTCPHEESFHVHLSGTEVRKKLQNGEELPKEFTRPEVANVLINGMGS